MPVTNLSRPLSRLIDLGYVPRELPLSGNQIDAWRQEGYSFLVIHELLRQRGVKCSETTVRRYIHRHFPSPVRPVMRRETKPAGAEWSDAWNGDRVHAGGTTVAAAAPIERIPAFIRGYDRDLGTLFQGLYLR